MASSAASSSTPPHFFKVILPHTLTQQKLEVPIKFVRKYGETLQIEEICLKVGNGASWNIGLKKSNNKVWLEKGWADFVKFYSIEIGHFIVFNYEGNSCFHVLIFDKAATGIEYPTVSENFNNKKMGVTREREEIEDNGGAQIILGKNKKSLRRKDEKNNVAQIIYHSPNSSKSRKRNDEAAGGSKIISKSHEFQKVKLEKEELQNNELSIVPELKHQGRNKVKCSRENPSIATHKARRNSEKASNFKSLITNPSFMVSIGSSYLDKGRGYVCIPKEFGSSHLGEIKELSLEVSNGKSWKVLCVERWYNKSGIHKFEMGSGWRAFARDNNLKKGDICVFELIKNIQISFKVTIFPLGL